MTHPIYSLDTSALLDGLERFYPSDVFPALWENIDALADGGRLFVSEEVWHELQKRDEVGAAWMAPRKDRIMVPTDADVAARVHHILSEPQHQRLVMSGKGRDRADPFVIAVAELYGTTVVTGERTGSPGRPRIPDVCDGRGVEWLSMLGLIKREKWAF